MTYSQNLPFSLHQGSESERERERPDQHDDKLPVSSFVNISWICNGNHFYNLKFTRIYKQIGIMVL